MIPELTRLNALARKAKTGTLNDAERDERNRLRQRYLQQIRGQVRHHLLATTIVDSEGRDVTPAKLQQAKTKTVH